MGSRQYFTKKTAVKLFSAMISRQYLTKQLALIALIMLGFCVFYLYPHPRELIKSKVYLAKRKFKTCMDEGAFFDRDDGFKFYDDFAECMEAYTSVDEKHMDVVYNGLSGEKKVYLPLSAEYPQDRCNFLTIGIGGNTVAEKFFKEKYPKCKFYGIEPGQAADFGDFGKVIPYGVGESQLSSSPLP